MILTRDHIQQVVSDFFKDKPVNKVWLFGSYVRGEADAKSDVDLMVEINPGAKVGLSYLTWHEDIEPLFKVKVEIVSSGGVSKYVQPFIDADKQLIYEK